MLRQLTVLAFLFLTVLPTATEASPGDAPGWNRTLDRVIPAVVSLRMNQTRAFEMDARGSTVGTGFVVDAEQGLILTNRHLVTAGPVVTEAVFLNDEEVSLEPVYRDPVHDFGFYRFQPGDLKHMDVAALELDPDGAEIGAEIRVVGNDAGEKVMILDGTIARLDRAAPDYEGYSDFNTFYVQAASGTSGGSSGSPVVNIKGQVVALNAGAAGDRANSSFFLPLERVVRALDLVRAGQPVSRGSLQAVFRHTSYDELARLGLSEESEAAARARFTSGNGLLVVSEVIPGGPGAGSLLPGDILISLNEAPLDSFVVLEEVLDSRVGQEVAVEVERGGARKTLQLGVSDLHSLMPTEFVEFGGGVLHEINYQLARAFNVAAEGVVLVDEGYVWRNAGVYPYAVLDEVGGVPIRDLDDLYGALSQRAHHERVPIRFHDIEDPRAPLVRTIQVDRFWFPMKRCALDERGDWPCTEAAQPPQGEPPSVDNTSTQVGGPPPLRKLAPSMVRVRSTLPFPYMEGTADNPRFTGHGLVVDADRGWVITDRNTVPLPVGDVSITVARSVRVPAEVLLVHPIHNLALIRYDPALLGTTKLRSADFSSASLEPGDDVWQVGLNSNGDHVAQETIVTRVEPVDIGVPDWPAFQAVNVDVIHSRDNEADLGGVLCDPRGRVQALWATFFRDGSGGRKTVNWGIPIQAVDSLLTQLRAGEAPRGLPAQLTSLPLTTARDMGLSQARVDEIERLDPERRQVLAVARTYSGTAAEELLVGGDLILAAEGQTVTRFEHLEVAAQKRELALTILRGGKELQLRVPTQQLTGQSLDAIGIWSGLVLHRPHWEVAAQTGFSREGVYVAIYYSGSPGDRFGVGSTSRIVAVDGVEITDLASFLALVSDKEDGEPVRLTLLSSSGQRYVRTLKVDLRYWPTRYFVRGSTGWRRGDLDEVAR